MTQNDPAQENYNVNIPDVARLMPMPDDGFLLYVVETLDPFDLTTPSFRECAELKALRQHTWPQEFEPPETVVTVARRAFAIHADGTVQRRTEQNTTTSLLLHSDTQAPLVSCGVLAFRAYSETGVIPPDLRARFMFEQTKEILRTAGYPFTPRYETFCMNVLYHVAEQIRTAYLETQKPDARAAHATAPKPPQR